MDMPVIEPRPWHWQASYQPCRSLCINNRYFMFLCRTSCKCVSEFRPLAHSSRSCQQSRQLCWVLKVR